MKTLHRLISGISIGAFWVCALWLLPAWVLFLAILFCSTLCQLEFYNLAERGGHVTCRWVGLALGAVWLATVFSFPCGGPPGPLAGDRWESLLAAGGGLLILMMLLFDPRVKRPFDAAAITLLGVFYVPFMLSFYIRLAQEGCSAPWTLSRGGIFVAFYLSLVVKLSDVGAYATGMLFGRHKMFPRISPGKSWEGLAGGLGLSVVASAVTVAIAHAGTVESTSFLCTLSYPVAAALGLLLGGVGVVGDLAESMLKRSVNAKDSSSTIPGMGGLLDVFDSLLLAPAILYFLLPWLKA